MPPIYVNTDNSSLTNKLYNAGKLGKSAAAAEKKMQQAVVEAISKVPDFNTDRPRQRLLDQDEGLDGACR